MEEKINDCIDISIVVPIYNCEQYLDKCIQSILSQTFKNFELILINDGSTDKSLDICNKYSRQDKRVVVINKKNDGVSITRNIGIDSARGKYIMFSDSDDFVEKKWCEKMYNIILNNKGSLVISGYNLCNVRNDNNEISKNVYNLNEAVSIVDKENIFQLYESAILNSPCNKIFDLNLIKNYKIRFDNKLSLGEDLLFVLEYLKYVKNEIVIINQAYYNYILRDSESLDNKYYKNLFDIYNKIYNELYESMISYNTDMKLQEVRFYKSYYNMLNKVLLNTFNKKNNESFIKRVKYNSEVLKSNEYKSCLKHIDKRNMNKIYQYCLNSGNYLLVHLYRKILSKKISR